MPVLPVSDVKQSLGFLEKLGFSTDFNAGGTYASASRDGRTVHITTMGDRKGLGDTGVFFVVEGLDDLKREIEDNGLELTEIRETPYQMREFDLNDPDGNTLAFAEHIAP